MMTTFEKTFFKIITIGFDFWTGWIEFIPIVSLALSDIGIFFEISWLPCKFRFYIWFGDPEKFFD